MLIGYERRIVASHTYCGLMAAFCMYGINLGWHYNLMGSFDPFPLKLTSDNPD